MFSDDFLFACVCESACLCLMIITMSMTMPVHMCAFGRVLSACMLGGVGIRNRLRGNWTAGRQREGGRADGGGWSAPAAAAAACGMITECLQSRPATSLFVGD